MGEIKGFSENKIINQDDDMKHSIFDLEATMNEMESSLDKFKLTHHFAPHCYAREMFLPKGHTIVGKIHKHAHLNIISKGVVVVSTEEGSKEIVAPCTFTSYAGTKRAVYVKEDAIWTTIHVTEETDLEKIEDEIIAKDFDEISCDKTEKLEVS